MRFMAFELRGPPAPSLIELLRSRHDDGEPPLWVRVSYSDPIVLSVCRHDGSHLSETEVAHVTAAIAAQEST